MSVETRHTTNNNDSNSNQESLILTEDDLIARSRYISINTNNDNEVDNHISSTLNVPEQEILESHQKAERKRMRRRSEPFSNVNMHHSRTDSTSSDLTYEDFDEEPAPAQFTATNNPSEDVPSNSLPSLPLMSGGHIGGVTPGGEDNNNDITATPVSARMIAVSIGSLQNYNITNDSSLKFKLPKFDLKKLRTETEEGKMPNIPTTTKLMLGTLPPPPFTNYEEHRQLLLLSQAPSVRPKISHTANTPHSTSANSVFGNKRSIFAKLRSPSLGAGLKVHSMASFNQNPLLAPSPQSGSIILGDGRGIKDTEATTNPYSEEAPVRVKKERKKKRKKPNKEEGEQQSVFLSAKERRERDKIEQERRKILYNLKHPPSQKERLRNQRKARIIKTINSFLSNFTHIRLFWHLLVIAIIIFNLIIIPVRACFYTYGHDPNEGYELWLAYTVVTDVILGIDIISNFFLDHDDPSQVVSSSNYHLDYDGSFSKWRKLPTSEKKRIAMSYVRNGLALDLIASFPVVILQHFPLIRPLTRNFPMFATDSYISITYWLRANQLLRIFRLSFYFNTVEETQKYISPSAYRITKVSFLLLILAHISACGFFFIISYNARSSPLGVNASFAGDEFILERGFWSQYIRCFYWALATMTSFDNTSPQKPNETIFAIVVCVIGNVLYISLMGIVASLFSTMDKSSAYFKEKMESINAYLAFREIPRDLRARVLNYYQYLWSSRKGINDDLFDDLPEYLRVDIALQLNHEIIEKVPLFKNVDQQFISSIVLRLQPRVCLPQALVVRKGEVGKEMFFISRGYVEVISEDGSTVYATLNEGMFFGEVSLLNNTKRNASVRAGTYCDMYILTKKDFNEVMDAFPEQKRIIMEEAKRRKMTTNN